MRDETLGVRDRSEVSPSSHRNLVVVRAGDTSLHPGWGAGEAGCGFDLFVSYFGDDPAAYRAPCENRCDQKGGKWDGIHALFAKRPDLLQLYDYVWSPTMTSKPTAQPSKAYSPRCAVSIWQ